MILFLQLCLLFLDHYEYNGGSAESLWTKFWFQLLASALTFAGALGVAYKIYILNKRKEIRVREEEKAERAIDLLRYVKNSLDLNLPNITLQISYFKILTDQLKDEMVSTHRLNLSNLKFDWITSIDKIQFRKAFFDYIPDSELNIAFEYNTLFSYSDFFNDIHNSIEKDVNRYLDGIYLQEERFKKAYLDLKPQIIQRLNYFPEMNDKVPPEMRDLIIRIDEYGKNVKNRTEQSSEIIKLITDLIAIFDKHESDLWRFELNNIIYIYNDLQSKYKLLINLLEEYSDTFEKAKKEISIVVEKLNSIPELYLDSKLVRG